MAIQLLILGLATYLVTGAVISAETWFLAGLLSIVVNPQLLEPWYPRPQDVLVNSLIAIVLTIIGKGPAARWARGTTAHASSLLASSESTNGTIALGEAAVTSSRLSMISDVG